MDKGSHALEYILALLLKTCRTFVEGINIVWRDLRPSYVSFHNFRRQSTICCKSEEIILHIYQDTSTELR